MARVPEIVRRNPVSQVAAQTPRAGQGWKALATIAGKAAEFIQPAALEQATEEGLQSVYRGDDGTLHVDKRNVLGGELADAHNSAAFAKYLSQRQIDIGETFSELAREYEFNPAGFKSASDEYMKMLVADENIPVVLKEDLLLGVQREAGRRFNGLLNSEIDRNYRESDQNTKAHRLTLAQDYANLYREGNFEAASEVYEEIEALTSFRQSADYITETPAAAKAYLQGIRADAKFARVSYSLSALDGAMEVPEEIRKEMDDLLNDPDLSATQRQKLYNATQSALKGVDAVSIANSLASSSYGAKVTRVESGGSATAKNPNSSATGLHQFVSGTWLGEIKKMRAFGGAKWAEGLSKAEILEMRKDPAASKEVFEFFTAGNVEILSKAGLPVNDATKYMAHFFGAGGAVKVLSADPSSLISDIDPNAVEANPFLKGMTAQDAYDWAARKMTVKASDIAAQQAVIGQIEDTEVRDMAAAELAKTMRPRIALENETLMEYETRLANLDATLNEREIATDHDLSDDAQNQLTKQLRSQRKEQYDAQTTVARLNDPNANFDVSDSAERKSLDSAYAQGTKDTPQLSPESLAAGAQISARTGYLPKGAFSDALGAMSGDDPAAFATAAEFMNQVLTHQGGAIDTHNNRSVVKDRLADYAFYAQYMGGEEAAARVIEMNSPEAVARRKNLSDAAKELSKGLKSDDVQKHLDSIYDDVNLGEDTGAIMADYERLFTDAYKQTGDSALARNRALKDMERIWGPNAVTGDNRVMKYPPQNFYPASIQDGHNWMTDQIEQEVSAYVFEDDAFKPEGAMGWFGDVALDISGGSKWVNSNDIKIMSDGITRQEVASGKPPSYTVLYQKDGMLEAVPGRYSFEAPAQPDMKSDFDQARAPSMNAEWQKFLRKNNMSVRDVLKEIEENPDKYKGMSVIEASEKMLNPAGE